MYKSLSSVFLKLGMKLALRISVKPSDIEGSLLEDLQKRNIKLCLDKAKFSKELKYLIVALFDNNDILSNLTCVY